MADKAVSELISAQLVKPDDHFVLEQDGTAKKLSGQTLINHLLSLIDGHGGIHDISKVSSNGLADTYRMTFADTTTYDFTVTNGRGISSVAKIGTSGLVDTYRVSYNDGTHFDFTVKNGEKGNTGQAWYVHIKYASQRPTDASHSMSDLPDNWMGVYSGTLAEAPADWQMYQWFQIKGEQGETGNPAMLTKNTVEYQASDSGSIIPSGTWSTAVPVVAQGKYLWTRTTTTFNTGSPVISYSVSRFGMDGTGSVSSVCGVSPDSDGNVALTAENTGALPSTGGDMSGPINMNGQSVTGLNDPTADTDAARKGYVDSFANSRRVRNLLDNSDFTNPVNQRGITTQTGVSTAYFIDRWYINRAAAIVNVSNNGIEINNNAATATSFMGQKIEFLKDGIYTAAAKVDGEIVLTVSNLIGGVADQTIVKETNECSVGLAVSTGYPLFQIIAKAGVSSGLVEWAALYEGEYTAETLPPYVPKGYGAELAECQRYYQVFSQNETHLYGNSGDVNGNSVRLVVPNAVKMRINPTVSAFNIAVLSGERISNYETTYTPSNCNSENGFLSFYGKVSPPIGIGSYTYRAIIAQLRNTKLEVSADL